MIDFKSNLDVKTPKEIFAEINERFIGAVMMHGQFADYFDFLAYVEEVMVKPQSYGGDTSGVNIPFKVSSDGKRTEGYVSATSLASGNPEFTAGTIPHSLSTGKEVL